MADVRNFNVSVSEPLRLKMASRGFREAQGAPKRAQDGPKKAPKTAPNPQHGPRPLHEVSKTAPRPARTATICFKQELGRTIASQTAPRPPASPPKEPSKASKRPKRSHQQASKTLPGRPRNATQHSCNVTAAPRSNIVEPLPRRPHDDSTEPVLFLLCALFM